MTDTRTDLPAFTLVRAYPNGSTKRQRVESQAEVDRWLDYNRLYRPSNALFVNGACVENGLLNRAVLDAVTIVINRPEARR